MWSPIGGEGLWHADDITVFTSRRLDIKAMKKVVEIYEEVADAKINLDKSKRLHPGGGFRAWPPTGGKLVGGLGQGRSYGRCLVWKALVLKRARWKRAPCTSSS